MWIINDNGTIYEYNDFIKAKNRFYACIKNSIFSNKQIFDYDNIPFEVGVLESSEYDSKTITDEHIVFFQRMRMVMVHLTLEPEAINDETINGYLPKNYYLSQYDEVGEMHFYLRIEKKDNNQILVDLDNENDTLTTNAFNIKEEIGDYYFKYNQEVIIKDMKDEEHWHELGTVVDCEITLMKEGE